MARRELKLVARPEQGMLSEGSEMTPATRRQAIVELLARAVRRLLAKRPNSSGAEPGHSGAAMSLVPDLPPVKPERPDLLVSPSGAHMTKVETV
jgi:hypothetical protein